MAGKKNLLAQCYDRQITQGLLAGLVVLCVSVQPTSSAFAAPAVTVIDADTLVVAGVQYRLDGVDAPENDQACLDDRRGSYYCGQAAPRGLVEVH